MTLAVLLFLLILYIHLRKYRYSVAAKRYIVLISIVLIAISTLRHEAVGNDTYAYIMSYENIHLKSWNEVLNRFWIRTFMPDSYEDRDPAVSVIMKVMNN